MLKYEFNAIMFCLLPIMCILFLSSCVFAILAIWYGISESSIMYGIGYEAREVYENVMNGFNHK